MNISLALEYIPKRMEELGHGNQYHIRFRHMVLQAGETRAIASYNQFFILVEASPDIRVESDSGVYDLSEDMVNEYQYEHSGELVLTNYSPVMSQLRMIQVILKK